MHKLLDRLNYIKEETKNMRQDFADSEEHVLGNVRQLAQNILKNTCDAEKLRVSGSIEKIGINIAMAIPKLISPDNIVADNLYQGVIQGQYRRDFQKNNLDLAYNNISKKISHMNAHEIFEFLDRFSKKNLYGISTPKRIIVETRPVKC